MSTIHLIYTQSAFVQMFLYRNTYYQIFSPLPTVKNVKKKIFIVGVRVCMCAFHECLPCK